MVLETDGDSRIHSKSDEVLLLSSKKVTIYGILAREHLLIISSWSSFPTSNPPMRRGDVSFLLLLLFYYARQ